MYVSNFVQIVTWVELYNTVIKTTLAQGYILIAGLDHVTENETRLHIVLI